MPQSETTEATTSQTEFWKANRDQYLVDPTLRNEANGRLGYPVPETKANRWVIIREIQDDGDPYELPSPVLIAEFEDREAAERLCELIMNTASRA